MQVYEAGGGIGFRPKMKIQFSNGFDSMQLNERLESFQEKQKRKAKEQNIFTRERRKKKKKAKE